MAEARIIDGKAIAAELREQVAASAARLRQSHGFTPGPTTILVGDDPASHTYVRAKAAACAASGLNSFERRLPGDTSEPELIAEIAQLNADERVDGILVQLPLPPQIDRHRVIAAIDPEKGRRRISPDQRRSFVDRDPRSCPVHARWLHGFAAFGLPDLAGAEAVVLGRSNIVGKPMAALLLAANCTVTMVHSRTTIRPRWPARRYPDSGDWKAAIDRRRVGQTRRDRYRCRHQPGARAGWPQAYRRRCRFWALRHRWRDHAGAGRRRANDDRLPVAQYVSCGLPPPRAPRPAAGLTGNRTKTLDPKA